MKEKYVAIATITILLSLSVIASLPFPLANGQSERPLPVILIHGYRQDASSWSIWEELLLNDGIPFHSVTFSQSDDSCGSAMDHAIELSQIVQQVRQETGSERVNIVGFSKGGLDARVYLQGGTDDVANLIMIGTPNAGSPLAVIYSDEEWCLPAGDDLKPGSDATQAIQNLNTNYHTISGDVLWGWWYPGNPEVPGRDDWVVPVKSVESEGYFQFRGRTPDNHLDLQTENEYNLAHSILAGN
jgi:pimeloyl-ACP methyl ester carboxylesterase